MNDPTPPDNDFAALGLNVGLVQALSAAGLTATGFIRWRLGTA